MDSGRLVSASCSRKWTTGILIHLISSTGQQFSCVGQTPVLTYFRFSISMTDEGTRLISPTGKRPLRLSSHCPFTRLLVSEMWDRRMVIVKWVNKSPWLSTMKRQRGGGGEECFSGKNIDVVKVEGDSLKGLWWRQLWPRESSPALKW